MLAHMIVTDDEGSIKLQQLSEPSTVTSCLLSRYEPMQLQTRAFEHSDVCVVIYLCALTDLLTV